MGGSQVDRINLKRISRKKDEREKKKIIIERNLSCFPFFYISPWKKIVAVRISIKSVPWKHIFLKLINILKARGVFYHPLYMHFHLSLCITKTNWIEWRNPHVQIPTDLIFSLSSTLVFKIFHHYRMTFLKKQLSILIAREILYHPVYLLIFLHS